MLQVAFWIGVIVAGGAVEAGGKPDSASALLEKGVYTEETVGDLDRAISLYEKVVAEAKAARMLAAQAQFRIGQCLNKKGKKAEARAAFEKLIADYPEAKELGAKARKFVPAGLPLQAVPWVDGETLQLDMRLAGMLDLGTTIYFARSAERNGQKIWRVGSRTLVVPSKMTGSSSVDAEWNTFRPIESTFRNSLLGNFFAQYTSGQVVLTRSSPEGQTPKKFDLSEVLYDNEQGMHVMRRLPLAVGYKTTLPIFATMGGGAIKLPLEVQGKETIKVPAGQFECFKVHLGMVNQTFWMATDPHRYLVKIEANAVDIRLTAFGQLKPGEPRRYDDAKFGFSIAAPAEWYFYPFRSSKVYLLDPDGVAMSAISAVKLSDLDQKQRESLRDWAGQRAAEIGKTFKGFQLRADGWQQRKIGVLPAVSFLADCSEGGRKMIVYGVCLQGKSAAVEVTAVLPENQWQTFRKSFDGIVDSLKVK